MFRFNSNADRAYSNLVETYTYVHNEHFYRVHLD